MRNGSRLPVFHFQIRIHTYYMLIHIIHIPLIYRIVRCTITIICPKLEHVETMDF